MLPSLILIQNSIYFWPLLAMAIFVVANNFFLKPIAYSIWRKKNSPPPSPPPLLADSPFPTRVLVPSSWCPFGFLITGFSIPMSDRHPHGWSPSPNCRLPFFSPRWCASLAGHWNLLPRPPTLLSSLPHLAPPSPSWHHRPWASAAIPVPSSCHYIILSRASIFAC